MAEDPALLEKLLDNAISRTYSEYVGGDFSKEQQQVEIGRKLEKQVLDQFAAYIGNKGYTLGTVSEERLTWARKKLFDGQVAGVDGRRDKPIDIISCV